MLLRDLNVAGSGISQPKFDDDHIRITDWEQALYWKCNDDHLGCVQRRIRRCSDYATVNGVAKGFTA